MKKSKNKSLVMTFVFAIATIVLIGGLFVKCQKQTETEASQTLQQDCTEYSLQEVEYPLPEYAEVDIQSIHFVDDIKFDEESEGLSESLLKILKKEQEKFRCYGDVVVFYIISPSLYYLPKDIKNHDEYFNLIKGDGSEFNILKYTIGEYNEELRAFPIIKVEVPLEDELKKAQELIEESMSDSNPQNRTLSTTMSSSQANQFFDQFAALNCDSILQCPCLTFQYATNGCEARAHYMKKLMEDAGYACEKIFAYPKSNSTYQRLNANSNAGCCADWYWHVAPLITTNLGVKKVIDPSICSAPVSVNTWKSAMQSNCLNAGVATISTYVMSSDNYAPNSSFTGYITDNNYSLTMQKLYTNYTKHGCN